MKPLTTRSWSTPLIIATSMAVAISGVLMFFHIAKDMVESMHEWLGLLFVLAIVLHILNHWLSFSRYFVDKRALAVVAVVVAVAIGWVVVSGQADEGKSRGNMFRQTVMVVQQAPLVKVAALQDQSSAVLIGRLQQAGITAESEQQSIDAIARSNQRRPEEVMAIVLSGGER